MSMSIGGIPLKLQCGSMEHSGCKSHQDEGAMAWNTRQFNYELSHGSEGTIVGKNHCTHALIIDVRISDNRLYHEARGDYTFFC